MKAYVRKGKWEGKIVPIGQWCNDWFTTGTGNRDIDARPFKPGQLVFSVHSMNEIRKHKNNGTLFEEYRAALLESPIIEGNERFSWTFKKLPKRKAKKTEEEYNLWKKAMLQYLEAAEATMPYDNSTFTWTAPTANAQLPVDRDIINEKLRKLYEGKKIKSNER